MIASGQERALEKAGFTREGVLRGGGSRPAARREGVRAATIRP
ncbi:hypothetical protein [Nonomuraea sp. NPDC052265]